MHRAVAGALAILLHATAWAQPMPLGDKALPVPPPIPANDPDRVRALEQQILELKQAQAEMAQKLELLHAQSAVLVPPEAPAAPPAPGMPASPAAAPAPTGLAAMFPVLSSIPIKLGASLSLRFDRTVNADQTDLLQGDNSINGFRARVRLWLIDDDPDSIVNGGLRLSTGENPNPTVPFVTLDDVWRPKSFGLDQYYFSIRPFKDRDLIYVTLGKQPQPFWRGDRGTWKSELIWDDDVNPEGLTLHVTFYKTKTRAGEEPTLKIDNQLGYYALSELINQRFVGLTGITYLVADQLRVFSKYASASLAFYDFENLNAGLVNPSLLPGSAFQVTAQSALLLRPGLWATNNHVNFGPGANGFLHDHIRMGNLTAQGRVPLPKTRIAEAEVWAVFDYAHNFIAARDRDGWGLTAGIKAGGWKGQALHPLNLWFTYRDVDADATLATFADSDLGNGTQYKGFEIGSNYRIIKNLMILSSYFRYYGYPNKDVLINRFFIDVVWDF